MSIQQANELVRQIAQEIGIEDLTFSDLVLALEVGGQSVTVEFLPRAGAFLVYGVAAVGLDARNVRVLAQVLDISHASAMMGGSPVTLSRHDGRAVVSERVDLEGLTSGRLGSLIGRVAESTVMVKDLLGQQPVEAAPPPDNFEMMRV